MQPTAKQGQLSWIVGYIWGIADDILRVLAERPGYTRQLRILQPDPASVQG